jgi:ppGpp synthetase/RelA/SpoT-type nucleotidyltranferase
MLTPTAWRFIRGYENRFAILENCAPVARKVVKELLHSLQLDTHVIIARPKSYHSALEKIRSKGYGSPSRQLTDQIGVRVITYYQDEVDVAANRLVEKLDVDERKSVDKRLDLGTWQFGYRSVHLIARLTDKQAELDDYKMLGRRVFEIQIRSILEHAWAEIEHEVNYKSGVDFPDRILRHFGAIAGTLEILEAQFLELRHEKLRLARSYRDEYALGNERLTEFDVARLLGYLEARFPSGVSMIGLKGETTFRPPHAESICRQALASAGIENAAEFDPLIRDRRFVRAVKRFANALGLEPAEVSHFALCVIAVSIKDINTLRDYPELDKDPNISKAIRG